MLKGNRRNLKRWGQTSTNSSHISLTEIRSKGCQEKDDKIIPVFNHTCNYFFTKNFGKKQRVSNQIKVINKRKKLLEKILLWNYLLLLTRKNINSPYKTTSGHPQTDHSLWWAFPFPSCPPHIPSCSRHPAILATLVLFQRATDTLSLFPLPGTLFSR